MDAATQLKYLAKTDFSPVKAAATQAIEDLGDFTPSNDPTNHHHPTPGLYRTRSMETGLDSNETRTKI